MIGTGKLLYVGLDSSRIGLPWDGEVVHLPLIETRLWESPLEYVDEIQKSTHILFTSREAVRYFFQFDIDIKEKSIIAVGKGTASAAKEFAADAEMIIAEEENAEGVIKLIDRMDRTDFHIFWPHSLLSRPLIAEYFTQKQIDFSECFLYETRRVAIELIPELRDFEAIYFTSPSTVEAFFSLYPTIPTTLTCIAIGPITSKRLDSHLHPLQSRKILATLNPQ
jgi:uroporphyrinogen-III synthase